MSIYFSDVLAALRSWEARVALVICVAGALGVVAVRHYGPRARHVAHARPAARVAAVSEREAAAARREMGRRWFVWERMATDEAVGLSRVRRRRAGARAPAS